MRMGRRKNISCILWFLIFTALGCYPQEVAVRNTARFVLGKWNWTIYLEAPQHILQDIQSVDYILYRSSSRPTTVRVSEQGSRSHPWSYSGESIGYFRIEARVRYKSGRLKVIEHTLVLNPNNSSPSYNIAADNVSTNIREGWWSWTVYIMAEDNVLNQIQCVEYTLHPTFPDPVKLVCERGTGTLAFPLTAFGWGTFNIAIRVFLINGQVKELSHYLRLEKQP